MTIIIRLDPHKSTSMVLSISVKPITGLDLSFDCMKTGGTFLVSCNVSVKSVFIGLD